MKRTDPVSFERACEWDEKIRGLKGSGENFVYRGYIPLRDAELDEVQDEFTIDDECDGMCGL